MLFLFFQVPNRKVKTTKKEILNTKLNLNMKYLN